MGRKPFLYQNLMKQNNITQIRDLINYTIANNIKKQEEFGKTPTALNLIGEAGIGKTSIVREIAAEKNMNFVKLNLAQLDEVGDIVGFPIKEVEAQMFKLTKEGETIKRTPVGKTWVTESSLKSLNPKSYMLTNKIRTSYAKPAWVPEYNENGTILLLDDFTRCTPVFAQAIMDLVWEQKYVSWSLPKKTTIILTSNPDNGAYNVTSLDPAQGGRCMNFGMKFDEDAWAQWAESQNIDSRCISFALQYASELFNTKENGQSIADARSYTTFCENIAGVGNWDDSDNLDFIQLLAGGCFNDEKGEVGSMFTSFIARKMHLLITPKQLLTGKWETIKDKLYEQTHKDGQLDTGVASLIARRFTNYVIAWLDSDEKTPFKVVEDRIVDFIENNVFTEDIYYSMVQRLLKVHKTQTSKLLQNPKINVKVI